MSEQTLPEVYILESLDVDDEEDRREGEVIARILRMAGKKPRYRYVRTERELKHFVREFTSSRYRYLHISCHGNESAFGLTLDDLTHEDFAAHLAPALDRRRLFLSTCLATTTEFAQMIFDRSWCFSVAGPIGTIGFPDAALFWAAFYHLMFKGSSRAMSANTIKKSMGELASTLDVGIRLYHPDVNRVARLVSFP